MGQDLLLRLPIHQIASQSYIHEDDHHILAIKYGLFADSLCNVNLFLFAKCSQLSLANKPVCAVCVSVCLSVCLDVNQGGTYHNRCTQRLVILHERTN